MGQLTTDEPGDYTVALTGVTGKTGSLIAADALARGWRVRSLARRMPAMGEWYRMDWDDCSSWWPGFAGCDAAYVLIPFNHPGAAERTPDVLRMAADSGVRRIVLLSSLDADGAPAGDPLTEAEDALVRLDVDWAILRPTWFMENFSVGSFGAMVREGCLRLPAGDGRIPFVAVHDVAQVAVAALTPDGPRGRLPLTGPEAVTHAQVCDALSAAIGQPVRWSHASPEEFTTLMKVRGFSEEYTRFLIAALDDVRTGRLIIPVTDIVTRITGNPAISLEHFASEMAATRVGEGS
ncbi:NAD(P)H-binding protein [Phytoactinopolyspora endophytica]|uniref:NAD(P)H-binding protein n=1 Tax=Phytoactinopolyspora endophytica TaxID=1642495 RepID=UPI00101C36D4|nr:NAD(P)H-binding protein [Phytoactinopolyspora endophytica]